MTLSPWNSMPYLALTGVRFDIFMLSKVNKWQIVYMIIAKELCSVNFQCIWRQCLHPILWCNLADLKSFCKNASIKLLSLKSKLLHIFVKLLIAALAVWNAEYFKPCLCNVKKNS
jgi:hypothetical protein